MPENQRLFIASFPPPALGRALHRLARRQHALLGGRCMPAANLHLTLTFLGQTPTASIPAILDLLQQMPALECTLTLDTLGTFLNGGIVWAGSASVPESLAEWVTQLRGGLQDNDIVFDNRPFRPHITLLRKAAQIEVPIEPALAWQLGRAELCISRSSADGSVYQVVSSASQPPAGTI